MLGLVSHVGPAAEGASIRSHTGSPTNNARDRVNRIIGQMMGLSARLAHQWAGGQSRPGEARAALTMRVPGRLLRCLYRPLIGMALARFERAMRERRKAQGGRQM